MYGGLLTGLYVTPARLTLKSTSSIPRGDYGDDDKGVREPSQQVANKTYGQQTRCV